MLAGVLVLLALGALALVHELGHLAGARALGLTVTDLSIGLGPPLRRWRLGDVTVALAPIPFGGFVRVSELLPEAAPDPARFRPRRVAARLLVTIAGSLANLLLAGVLAAVAALCCGADTGRIAGLQVTSAGEAAAAGLRPGDVVERIDGVAVASVEELGQALAGKRRARLAARRAGRPLALEVTPLERGGRFGLGARYVVLPELAKVSVGGALLAGAREPLVRSAELLGGAGRLWRGARADRPVGAVGLAGRVSQSRGWDLRRVLALGTVLSCAVGLFNLLPFPGLDGGRVCLELVEAGRRRRLPPRVATGVQVAGALLLLVAWLVITIADVAAPR